MAALQSVPCCSSVFPPTSRLITRSLKPSPPFSKTHNFPFPKRYANTSKFLPLSPPRGAAPPAPTGQQEEDEEVLVVDETGNESSSDKFSWRDHWYPVSLVEDLDPKLPTAFQLLGRDLVIWFDRNDDQWAVFDDKCPHRLAPLKEESMKMGICSAHIMDGHSLVVGHVLRYPKLLQKVLKRVR